MRSYPVDIDPEQIVRWLRSESPAALSQLRITATRISEHKEIAPREATHLGDDELEDISEVATVATLEITPAHAGEGWLLTVVVEDEAGPRLPDKGMLIEGEQKMDLNQFYREFIRSDRGAASVVAQVEGAEAEARLARLLDAIEADRHSADDPPESSSTIRV